MNPKLASPYSGLLYGIFAYIVWGLAPIYFKQLTHIPPEEVLSHRAIWSVVLLTLIVLLTKRWPILRAIIRQPKKFFLLIISALLIGVNWLIFINAVAHDQLLAASLGYYINPLVVILLAVLFLKERLSWRQGVAIGLAAIGVLIQIYLSGEFPWIALSLAFSFGIYALIRKYISVDAMSGLLIETVVISFFAAYFLFGIESQTGNLVENSWSLNLTLMSAGIITTLPLLFYAEATVRINLSTLGFLQYIAPTIMWLLAIFMFNEPFSSTTLLSFGFIWLGLICFSIDGFLKKSRG
jgi:chloramphenicol-sensitive protein RarD